MRATVNNSVIETLIKERFENYKRAVISMLQRIGERFITNARNNGNYKDQTGNLRGSIGYIILVDGQQLQSGGFKPGAGGVKGQQFINSIKGNYPTGIVLVVVAGMDYAGFVEAKGRDVLTGSSQTAVVDLRNAIDQIRRAA